MKYKKKKIDKVKAMLIISNATKKNSKGYSKRKESRYYFCDSCKSYHTTSKKEGSDLTNKHIHQNKDGGDGILLLDNYSAGDS